MRATAGFGRIERWDDGRGFGFITPEESVAGAPQRLFFHVRDFDRSTARPCVGARVRYVPERQSDGRWRAIRVAAVGVAASSGARTAGSRRGPSAAPAAPGARGLWIAIIVWIALLAAAHVSGRLPPLALAAAVGLNALTFIAFALDKRAAQQKRWRTPEAHLHLLELLGGWPASGFAQQLLRHKRAKPAYRRAFGVMIVLHLLALGAWTFA